jgi:mannitol-1-phosphate 5-dehydrogenase
MAEHILTGFGFGPIQAGLFIKEAFQTGNFSRLVVAEIDAPLVDAVKANKGSYFVNIAKADGIEILKVDNVELLNPNVPEDRQTLLQALSQSTEITTCLPSVNSYEAGENSVASLIAEALKNRTAKAAIIYTAENNNHAAQILQKAVTKKTGALPEQSVQFLNTVIGKMSRVVTDPAEVKDLNLKTIAPGIDRAFLVEQFNRILVSKTRFPDFHPGIGIFIEKDDLMPFEEAKLYGHNAIHSLLGFIGALKGYTKITELANDPAIMQIGRAAYSREYGAALIKKYSHLGDELFTSSGFKDYTEDLLTRMTNPFLGDTIARVVRDIPRKLEMNGRIFGTMQLILQYGLEPKNMALGAIAGIALLLQKADDYNLPLDLRIEKWQKLDDTKIEKIINWLWSEQKNQYTLQIIKLTQSTLKPLTTLILE